MISKETLLEKMEEALRLAKQSPNEEVMMQEIQKLHVIAELMLEAKAVGEKGRQIPPQMVDSPQVTPAQVVTPSVEQTPINIKDDDGTSIFDF